MLLHPQNQTWAVNPPVSQDLTLSQNEMETTQPVLTIQASRPESWVRRSTRATRKPKRYDDEAS